MGIQVTFENMRAIGTGASRSDILQALTDIINNEGDKYFLDTVDRVSQFLGQCAWESAYFSNMEESLNYSAKRMMQVWPSRFKTAEIAKSYANNPQALANYVYGTRMGNRAGTNDGYNYRGRGIKQLTGSDNYHAFDKWIHQYYPTAPDFVKNPDAVTQMPWAVMSAVWFWVTNRIYKYADKKDTVGATKAINGGDEGLTQRTIAVNKATKVLSTAPTKSQVDKKPKKGDPVVMDYQQKLKRISDYKSLPDLDPGNADGYFGPKMSKALEAFQKSAGKLKVDGVLGPETKEAIDNVIAIMDTGKTSAIQSDLVTAAAPVPPTDPEQVPVSIPSKLISVINKPVYQNKSLLSYVFMGGGLSTFFYNAWTGMTAWFRSFDPIVQVAIIFFFAVGVYFAIRAIRDFFKARKGLDELHNNVVNAMDQLNQSSNQ